MEKGYYPENLDSWDSGPMMSPLDVVARCGLGLSPTGDGEAEFTVGSEMDG